MSEYGFTKKDWALFREKVDDWQEAYMDKLNKEYIELLTGDGRPSEKFWALEERIRNDKKDTGVQLRMSHSNFIYNIVSLMNEGAITMENLEEFSDELKERVRKYHCWYFRHFFYRFFAIFNPSTQLHKITIVS